MEHVSPDTCPMISPESFIVLVIFQSSNLTPTLFPSFHSSELGVGIRSCWSPRISVSWNTCQSTVHIESCLSKDESVSRKRIRPTLFPSVDFPEHGPTRGCKHPLKTTEIFGSTVVTGRLYVTTVYEIVVMRSCWSPQIPVSWSTCQR